MQSFCERRSYERSSERALTRDEREWKRNQIYNPWAHVEANSKLDERELKFALIFCPH